MSAEKELVRLRDAANEVVAYAGCHGSIEALGRASGSAQETQENRMSNELIRELVEALVSETATVERLAKRNGFGFSDPHSVLLAKARAYLETGGWTRVEDGLPVVPERRLQQVLVASKLWDGRYFVVEATYLNKWQVEDASALELSELTGFFRDVNVSDEYSEMWESMNEPGQFGHHVTHWQPLPEPPKG